MKQKYKMIRVTVGVHKELNKSIERRKKALQRNVTASELIGDMIRQSR